MEIKQPICPVCGKPYSQMPTSWRNQVDHAGHLRVLYGESGEIRDYKDEKIGRYSYALDVESSRPRVNQVKTVKVPA